MLRAFFLSAVLASPVSSQPLSTPAAEIEIRHTLDSFFRARLAGDVEKTLQFLIPGAIDYSAGGVTLSLWRRMQRPSLAPTANLIRHVEILTPDSAVAIGLTRVPGQKPPLDAGLRDLFLIRKDGAWKIKSQRSGALMSPATAAPVIEGRDPNVESVSGWKSLFDGKSIDGWVTMSGKAKLPPSWRIVEGCLMTAQAPVMTALRTRREFTEFELGFEWQVQQKANSGVKYRLFGVELWADGEGGDGAGFEYQVADDDGDPGAKVDMSQKSGALYGVQPVRRSATRPIGEWNESRIVMRKDHVEHWLNGEKTAEYPIDVIFPSPIVLQHHNSEVRFRNLRIKE